MYPVSQRSPPLYLRLLARAICAFFSSLKFLLLHFECIFIVMHPTYHSFQHSSNMATRYLHKVLSLFHRQPNKRNVSHSYRTINGVFGDWKTSAVEDVYTDSPLIKIYSQDEKSIPPPSFEAPCMPICPHEKMSFEDLQEIVNSLAINRTMDALTTNCREHRTHMDPVTRKIKTVCLSSPGLLRGFGTYALEPHTPRIVLSFEWDLGSLDGIRGQIETATELQHFLRVERIQLCAHKHISDSDVINAIFGLVQTPVIQNVLTCCDMCGAQIMVFASMEGHDQMCRVMTKRYLGTVEKLDDLAWLVQCNV